LIRAAFRVVTVSSRVAFVLVFVSLMFASGASAANQPTITGQYAIVVDADTGKVLLDKSMDVPTAPASLTKIFTAIYALESSPIDRTLTVVPSDVVGESSMGLAAGNTISLETALNGMLLPSGNDAAMTVAQNLGAMPGDTPEQSVARYIGWENDMASRLGLSETHLVNPHGLDQSGHVTSARDLAGITMFALKNAEFRKIIGTQEYNGDGFQLAQANRLLGSYPGLIGGKTGITDKAGYSLVEAAARNGHTIIAVVLDSTDAAWYSDATALLDYGFSVLDSGQVQSGLPTIALSPVVIQQGTQGVAPPPHPAATPVSSGAATALSVRQVNDNVAVVRHNLLGTGSSGFSWKWPVTSLISMVAVLALALNYPIVIGAGSLVWKYGKPSRRVIASPVALALMSGRALQRPRRRTRRRSAARRRRPATTYQEPVAQVEPSPFGERYAEADYNSLMELNVVPLNAAETIASRGVRLAIRGDYHAATSEFLRALRTDSTFDLSRSPSFWAMQPAGFVAAARAYALTDRTADAKSLLTVIKLSCGSHRELEALLMQVVTPVSR
jgi:serine-type D-Ala-D-Ala carboxypeptidase (penicillin-binding protein 5/6)